MYFVENKSFDIHNLGFNKYEIKNSRHNSMYKRQIDTHFDKETLENNVFAFATKAESKFIDISSVAPSNVPNNCIFNLFI